MKRSKSRNSRVVVRKNGAVELQNNPRIGVTVNERGNKKGVSLTIETDGNRYTINHNVKALYRVLSAYFEENESEGSDTST